MGLIHSYDDTKKMLKTLRNLNEQMQDNVGGEDPTQPQKDGIEVVNDVDVKLLSSDQTDLELSEEHKQIISDVIDGFLSQVSQVAILEPGFTISSSQVRLDGTLSDYDLRFVLIGGEQRGFYLNSEMLEVDDDCFILINKLLKFQMTFKDAVEPIIRDRRVN